jgi:hypothetical protein
LLLLLLLSHVKTLSGCVVSPSAVNFNTEIVNIINKHFVNIEEFSLEGSSLNLQSMMKRINV